MVLQRLLYPGLALLVLVGARPAGAAAITFTGNVANDFGSTSGVFDVPGLSNPLDIGQSSAITNAGDISGWAIKDIALSYDKTTDTMYVGVETFTNSHGVKSIAGDAYGSGTETGTDNPPNFGVNTPGSDKSITVAFAPDSPGNSNQPGTPTVVAGVPANKSANGSGIDGFTVANYAASSAIQTSFGSTLINNTGALAFNPNAAHPDFEFTITNFSHLPGISVSKGFWVAAYAGSLKDVSVGETYIDFTRVIVPQPQEIPEPATVLAWSVLAGAVACGRIRRKAAARFARGK
ncbi:MAG: hypothetical protein P4L84_37730 [Isosphaeraceae bacterium]|nr:hypothetical protein [Isosphaeraceae bacterium]